MQLNRKTQFIKRKPQFTVDIIKSNINFERKTVFDHEPMITGVNYSLRSINQVSRPQYQPSLCVFGREYKLHLEKAGFTVVNYSLRSIKQVFLPKLSISAVIVCFHSRIQVIFRKTVFYGRELQFTFDKLSFSIEKPSLSTENYSLRLKNQVSRTYYEFQPLLCVFCRDYKL